ncbi:ThiF family protein [Sodiomyces alkalinus F11]|uniref:NEDD8-activating enzyme E1 regulatory subunit n=1 Tax=Sodiomyces alkalinus (strain CBS 110278 / VKM F-3762 / F11) TaxID=1314773 RepID=A0A3N2PW42_SODAK|nr:ThiF family protein [Sodiomyces alkalinus F11]ROT38719.1 ThiF family protein [Sodiomyces alkalinus F11]
MTEVITQTPPILTGAPSDKERKYDRQLRLWAASGQAALESSHILLVNSGTGTVGIETLKNLVLPGIGKFTIADDAIVRDSDLGVNFFLDEDGLGKSRAQHCTELLVELNPEVQGDWFPKNGEPLSLPDVLGNEGPYTAVLYALPVHPRCELLLQEYCNQNKTPLIAVHSTGFYADFKITFPGPFPVVETHPDVTATTDLRLLSPWDELIDFARGMTKDIDSLDNHEHGHLPFVVILLHYLDVWKATHNSAYPSTYAEKVAFRKMVSEAARTDNPEGGEENFDEAVAAVLKTVSPPSLPGDVKEVFAYEHDSPIRSSFWIIADAVKEFYEKHGCLPLPGGLPDMKAQSSVYIQLQNIYKRKARRDAAEVFESVRRASGGDAIDPAEVDLFCKNAAFVKLINPKNNDPERLLEVADEELANDEMAKEGIMPPSLFPIYLALRATAYTPSVETSFPEDILKDMMTLVPQLGDQEPYAHERYEQAAQEVIRGASGELHNVSAVMGGMVAQEMIKIITKQYIPINNTCIFDGIGSRCQVLRL